MLSFYFFFFTWDPKIFMRCLIHRRRFEEVTMYVVVGHLFSFFFFQRINRVVLIHLPFLTLLRSVVQLWDFWLALVHRWKKMNTLLFSKQLFVYFFILFLSFIQHILGTCSTSSTVAGGRGTLLTKTIRASLMSF